MRSLGNEELGWGFCPQTPGIDRFAARMNGRRHGPPPAIPAAESALGLRPRRALSSAQLFSEWITSTPPCNRIAANGDYPLNCLSHDWGSLQVFTGRGDGGGGGGTQRGGHAARRAAVSVAGEPLPGCAGSGTGEPRAELLPLCRRLQHLCGQRGGGEASVGGDRGLDREASAFASEPCQERGREALGAEVSGVSHQPQRAARSGAAECGAIQTEGARDLAQWSQCHESGVTRRVAAIRGGLVGIVPTGPAASECLSAGRLDPATQAEVLLAALAQEARPPESVTAAGGGRRAAACSRDASWSVEYGASCVVAHGAVERHSETLRVGGAIESCGVQVRSLDPTAGYGKPYVRWCGRVPGRNPRHPTRSIWLLRFCPLLGFDS